MFLCWRNVAFEDFVQALTRKVCECPSLFQGGSLAVYVTYISVLRHVNWMRH